MKNASQAAPMFLVTVLRQGSPEPLVTLETHDKNEAIEKLKALDNEWIESVKDNRPFRITLPFYASFTPSLVIEIKVEELSAEDYARLKDGFTQEMREHGLKGFAEKNNWGA